MVDTNVLARFSDPSHAHHAVTVQALMILQNEGHRLCFTPQIKREFLGVAQRQLGAGPGNNGLGLSKEQSLIWLRKFYLSFEYLADVESIDEHFDRLHRMYGGGKRVHDLNIVASMLAHRVDFILTFNLRDFRPIVSQGIQVHSPEEVVLGQVDGI